MKKTYVSPSIQTEQVEIGVFGCTYGGGSGGWDGGWDGGHHHHRHGWGWWPFGGGQ